MLSNRPITIPRRPAGQDWFSRELASKQHRSDAIAADAAWDRSLREGLSLGRMTGLNPARDPLTAEAEVWLHMFGRLDCSLDISPYSRTLGYRMPPGSEEEGARLIGWLDAAEHRIPGITARVIELAFNYDGLEQVLVSARQKAADAQRTRADARRRASLAKQEG